MLAVGCFGGQGIPLLASWLVARISSKNQGIPCPSLGLATLVGKVVLVSETMLLVVELCPLTTPWFTPDRGCTLMKNYVSDL